MRLLMGKAKSGKTSLVNSEISNAILEGLSHTIILLVPEQYTLEAEIQLIQNLKSEGILGVEVLSFKRLCHRILEETGHPDTLGMSDVGKRMTLRKVFMDEKTQLKTYGHVADKAGFLSKFYETLHMLKQAMITPDAVMQIAENTLDNPLLFGKLNDIALVFSRYEQLKESIFSDAEDRYNLAIERLPLSKWIKDKRIWVDGFDSFTNQEYEIIRQLERYALRLSVTLCLDIPLSNGVLSHVERAYLKFKKMSEDNAFEVNEILLGDDQPVENFTFLAENIMSYPYAVKREPVSNVDVFAATTRHSEVVKCAIRMIENVRDKGYDWKDMAVVTNALSIYEPAIYSVFKMYNIPYFLDSKGDVMTHPLVHLIVSSCRAIVSHQSHQAIVQTLKSGYFKLLVEDIAALEMYMIQYGLSERHMSEPFIKEPYFSVKLDTINGVRAQYAQALKPLKEVHLSKDKTVKDFVVAIVQMLEHLKVHAVLEQQVTSFMKEGHFDEAQRYAQIWNLIMGVFEEIVLLMGDMPMDMAAFLPLLETGFEALEVGHLPLDNNRVIIGSLDRSKAHPIKILYILGLNEGILPEMASDGQLIGDAEKEYLTAMGYSLLPDQTMFINKEMFNIYMALTRPSEQLHLSYARSDSEGASLRPSQLIAKTMKVLPQVPFEHESGLDAYGFDLRDLSSVDASLPQLASALRRHRETGNLQMEWLPVLEWYKVNQPQRAQSLLQGLHHDNLVAQLSAESLEKAYSMPIKTSVSRLEDYVQCPFKYFVSTGLAPKTVKPFRMDYPDVGILFHKALENFGKALYTQGHEWQGLSETACETIMDGIVDEMVDIDLFQSKNAYRYLIQKLKRVSKRAAVTLTKHLKQGKFVPAAFELLFSESGYGVPPIVIELESGKKLFLRGVIDRVDLLETEGETYVKIIDYKSGQQKMSFSEVYHGLQMQLLVYLQACLQSPSYFRVDALKPAGAFYFKIDDPLLQSTEQVVERLSDELYQKLRLDGIVIDVQSIIEQMDKEALEKGVSDVIQVKVKSDGSYTKDSNVVPVEDLHLMMNWVQKTVERIGNSLYKGVIDISPCQMGNFKSCHYCDYKALCQFDVKFKNNVYHKLTPLSDDEVFESMRKQEEAAHGELDI